jgi:hypothetical protein
VTISIQTYKLDPKPTISIKNQQPDLTHRSDDVRSEQSIGFLVCENFDESVGFADRLCAAVGDEGELADVVFDTL